MVCSAAPVLLLAMTLPLVGSPVVQASQPGQSQAGGESGQQLDQRSGAAAAPSAPVESVLASVYVQLDLSNQTWPLALSKTLTHPLASDSSFSRTLTGLSLTTECNGHDNGQTYCACLSGYQWNASICSHHPPCQTAHNHGPCGCLVFGPTEAGYCQLLPPVPGRLSPNSCVQAPGTTLNLTLVKSRETTNLNWFLRHADSPTPILLQPGTHVSLASSPGEAVLSILNVSHRWAGEYLCCFEAQGFRWELSQVVKVPLQASDVARLPDQLSISCATCPGFQLTCCIPSTHLAYTASWSPGEGSKASLVSRPGSRCFVLAVQRCPAADTTYTCELQSPGLSPLRVPISVTIIQDGDNTCPEDSSAVAWNVTKAGHVAQAPCPVNRTGMVKRTCGPDGNWEPVHSSCTDAELLALHHRAQLLQAGQGWPAVEVPQILAQLSEQVTVVSSPSDLLALLGTISVLAKLVVDARIQLTRRDLEALLKTTDKILDMDTSSLWAPAQAQKPSAGSAFLLALETLACSLCPQDHPFSFSLRNVWLQTQLLGPTFPADYRVSFSTQPPLQAHIPRCSLALLGHNATNISVTSLVLQKLDRLLPSNYGQGLGDSLYATPGLVLSISIMAGGQAFNQGEVIMDFGNTASTPHCVFWDHDLFQGKGGWSDEGCQVQTAHASPTTQCICRHLTAFSILMSRNTVPENPTLELLSQVGLGASILALLVCLGVYRLVWRVVVQNKVAYLRHMALLNVVLCLLAADTCFLGAPLLPPGPRSPLCLAAAFLCHFFYLATFFWMLAQALMLAHQLLFVFRQLSKCRVLSLMVVLGYMCPMGFAGAALGLYLPRGQYLGEEACWLNRKGGVLYTFVGPVLAIVGMNGLVLAMAVLKLLRPSLSEGPQVEKRHALLGVIKALLILTPIFGLTWGLGLATLLEEVSVIPHYIFTILNTTQGVFILLFGCLMDKKIREALLERFCRTQPPNSTMSLATYETYIPEPSKGRSEDTS
ncbi:adhesion G-protein coupled receptor F3 isoform X1 [Ursus americanus]|uniref:adhesion G-protein coupled receptor F3 isoform X1 n=1 Tax=Ursus americanus TaxID=9643 RepID=UPI001E67A8D8|nr:adhesion G-protein coupled receptor F3 isoform X1 [Ursus americanus]XP_045665204.1 adhesion G-protein coupled receptor F3 isoform X1 [Ursus americanus]